MRHRREETNILVLDDAPAAGVTGLSIIDDELSCAGPAEPQQPRVSPPSSTPPRPASEDCRPAACSSIDLDAWRSDLSRLHSTIDQVVQSFISSQTRQLDAVAIELSAQREKISTKEQHFAELSDSIASFVEQEARKLEVWGVPLDDPEAEARHAAYDAELPGPLALHRIGRLWRKTTKAFEAAKEAREREAGKALEEQRVHLEGLVADAEKRLQMQKGQLDEEIGKLTERIHELQNDGERKCTEVAERSKDVSELMSRLEALEVDLSQSARQLEEAGAAASRKEYEWEAEREELSRKIQTAAQSTTELESAVASGQEREAELERKVAERGCKLQQMQKLMDEQEAEMTQKIERVQQYVKERQAGALHADKKQQDAERLAERWQGEVKRLQAEKDRLAKLVLDLESSHSIQGKNFQGVQEQLKNEANSLREALRKKEEEMRNANFELLHKREGEYQAQVNLERQREKERSLGMLKKKDQEVTIKDQQLRAAQKRIQELEAGQEPSSRGSTPGISRRGLDKDTGLPPLPLSAR
eukprot:gnl/TRDRNA2_/TRDRNA2_85888_c0_seq1.p1 gnl/TRDRNA2_/TRDRNA2_85888_c0~~gnl/TRDRNA2_/TRDRNA2_85888_c0_seq1.p1  ORF type:complete len:532 (+),score=179.25 gnl/TRDRNA2_/TRDRNA2_85888_c0_seq1:108-1703(+)